MGMLGEQRWAQEVVSFTESGWEAEWLPEDRTAEPSFEGSGWHHVGRSLYAEGMWGKRRDHITTDGGGGMMRLGAHRRRPRGPQSGGAPQSGSCMGGVLKPVRAV